MTLTRRHRVQLVAFVLIAAISVLYAGAKYAGLDRVFGNRGYEVTVRLADSGGVFVNSEVTYRGVTVGRVAELVLAESGVDLKLDIDSGGPEIPADTSAVVANRSAVGEQYLDLRPNTNQAPFLAEGAVIEQDRTAIPVSPDTVLSNLDALVSSVDTAALRTVVDESYLAFADAGPDLRLLLDTSQSFVTAAQEHLPQTKELLADARVVLDTQRRQGGNISSIASGLREITAQLKESDPDLRRILDEAPLLSRQVSGVLAESGTDLGVLFANLLTTAQVTTVRVDSIEQLLVAYPVISAFSHSVTSNGEGHLGFVLNLFDPHSCTKGYEGTRQRPANDTSEQPANTQAYCAEPPGSPTGVRGAQNAPYAGRPVDVPARPAAPPPAAEPGRPALPGLLDRTRTTTDSGLGGLGGLLGVP